MEQQTCTIGLVEIILLGIIGFLVFLIVKQLWILVFSADKSDEEYSDLCPKEDPYVSHKEYIRKKEYITKKYNHSGREVPDIDLDIDDSPNHDYSSVISHSHQSSGGWFGSSSSSHDSGSYGDSGGGDSGSGGGGD